MSYYDRTTTTHLDGSPIFKTDEDEQNEATIASTIEESWGCKLHSFGRLSPIDWWAERDGRVVGVAELKSRSHSVGKYPTVFLNVRKWLALILAGNGMGVPALFIVKWPDDARWIHVGTIDASMLRVGGCARTVKSRSDVEPVIDVPIDAMISLKQRAPA